MLTFSRGRTRHPTLAEHAVVELLSDIDLDDGRRLVAGTRGAVIVVWESGEAYDVEFVEPFQTVVTLDAHQIVEAPAP